MSNKTHAKSHYGREHKKEQFSKPAGRNPDWTMWLVIVVLLAVVAYLVVGLARQGPAITTVSAKTIQVGPGTSEVRVPLSEVNSGQAKFFEATLPNNTTTRFFVIKTSDGIYRAALDACQVCYGFHKGYYQDGDQMVCKKCGRHFPVNTIGYGTTGCHPMGLHSTVDGNDLLIQTGELETGGQYF